MIFGSLFTGIGGLDLGLERAGMTCVWQVEIDNYCRKVLEKHWSKVERFRDVRKVGRHNLAPIDLIVGGFPCQPHSIAGKRRGKEDDRNLWPEYLRVIQELKPRWVVGENVPGIITTMLDDVLVDLGGAGYTSVTFNIPAAAFGANHKRYRIFVISHTNSNRWSESCEQWEDRAEAGSADVPNATITGLEGTDSERSARSERRPLQFSGCDWWSIEPNVGRVAHGVPNRVDRLKALGNAVVPQVAEFIGLSIMAAEKAQAVMKAESEE